MLEYKLLNIFRRNKSEIFRIQGAAGKFVSHIEGDFDTVVGLSSALVRELMTRL